MSGEPVDDHTPEAEGWSVDPDFPDDDVALATTGFFMLVRLAPQDVPLARAGIEAVVRSLRDTTGPDAPTLGMMGVPTLIEDGLVRATLAEAAPSAREALGELERLVVAAGPTACAAAAGRIREAIRTADARLAPGAGTRAPDGPDAPGAPHRP